MHWDANGVRLLRQRSGERLPDPPTGVGRKTEPETVVEFLDGPHQTDITLLDKIEIGKPMAAIFFCDGSDKTKIRFDKVVFCRGHLLSPGSNRANLATEFCYRHADLLLQGADFFLVVRSFGEFFCESSCPFMDFLVLLNDPIYLLLIEIEVFN